MIFEINGESYKERPQSTFIGNSLLYAALFLTTFGGYGFNNTKERPEVDLIEEYKLILQKKSSLSRSNREYIIREFNKRFIKI